VVQIKVLRMGEASSRRGGIQRAVTGAKCDLRAKQIVATKAAISLAFSRCVPCRGVYRIAATQPRCLPGSSFPGGWAHPRQSATAGCDTDSSRIASPDQVGTLS
jgi:hypothetical protein